MELHGGIVHRNGLLQHGKIVDRACILQRVIGKGHILCGQRLSIRKSHIIPDLHLPGEPVLTGLDVLRQIIADLKVRRGHRQSALDQRLVDVLTGSPAVCRVKACLCGLGASAFRRPGSLCPLTAFCLCISCRFCVFLSAGAARHTGGRQRRRQKGGCHSPFFLMSHIRFLSFFCKTIRNTLRKFLMAIAVVAKVSCTRRLWLAARANKKVPEKSGSFCSLYLPGT